MCREVFIVKKTNNGTEKLSSFPPFTMRVRCRALTTSGILVARIFCFISTVTPEVTPLTGALLQSSKNYTSDGPTLGMPTAAAAFCSSNTINEDKSSPGHSDWSHFSPKWISQMIHILIKKLPSQQGTSAYHPFQFSTLYHFNSILWYYCSPFLFSNSLDTLLVSSLVNKVGSLQMDFSAASLTWIVPGLDPTRSIRNWSYFLDLWRPLREAPHNSRCHNRQCQGHWMLSHTGLRPQVGWLLVLRLLTNKEYLQQLLVFNFPAVP